VRGSGGGLAVGSGVTRRWGHRLGRGRSVHEVRGGRLPKPNTEEAGDSDVYELETGDGKPRASRVAGSRAPAMA
jgi:hypothetical protein